MKRRRSVSTAIDRPDPKEGGTLQEFDGRFDKVRGGVDKTLPHRLLTRCIRENGLIRKEGI